MEAAPRLKFPAIKDFSKSFPAADTPCANQDGAICAAEALGYIFYLRIDRLATLTDEKLRKNVFLGIRSKSNESNSISFGQQFFINGSPFIFLAVYRSMEPDKYGQITALVVPNANSEFGTLQLQQHPLEVLQLSSEGPNLCDMITQLTPYQVKDFYANMLAFFAERAQPADSRHGAAAQRQELSRAKADLKSYKGDYFETIKLQDERNAAIQAKKNQTKADKKRKAAAEAVAAAKVDKKKKICAVAAVKPLNVIPARADHRDVEIRLTRVEGDMKMIAAQHAMMSQRQDQHDATLQKLEANYTGVTDSLKQFIQVVGDHTAKSAKESVTEKGKIDEKFESLQAQITLNNGKIQSDLRHVVDFTTEFKEDILEYIEGAKEQWGLFENEPQPRVRGRPSQNKQRQIQGSTSKQLNYVRSLW